MKKNTQKIAFRFFKKKIWKIENERKPGLGKNPGNFKKPMGMGKTGFYREKWEKREKLFFF
jgi:hypothetical protein